MPRLPRIHYPDAVYHVMSRGVDKRLIFLSDTDREIFLAYLRGVLAEDKIALFSYCLMGNHFHLLLAVSGTPLCLAMHKLLTRYSLYFNRVHDRVGHLFQSRYTALLCRDLAYLIQLAAYINLNPVRAGLAAEPSAWQWSSHDELVKGAGRMLSLQRLMDVTSMGREELVERYLERIATNVETTPAAHHTILELIATAAARSGISYSDLLAGKRGGPYTKAKRLVVDWGKAEGYTDQEIARSLNCSKGAISLLRLRRRYVVKK